MSALRSKLIALLILAPASMFSFEVFGDFLYWKASEQPSLLWASTLGSTLGGIEVFEGENVTFDWNTGFRVGGGHTFDCDCWDVRAYWTRFHSKGDKAIPQKDQIIFTQFFAGFLKEDLADSAKINLSLKYNMFDGQVGKNFCFCECISLTPYIGLKGGWIDQAICTEWENFILLPFSRYTSTEDVTNDFWGVGPSAGVDSKWELGHCFSLFGDFDMAVLWGTWKSTDVYENSRSEVSNVRMNDTHLGSLMIGAFAGLGWETDISEWAHFAARLGYEGQIWFNQFRIPTFQQLRVHGDLTLQGGTLNLSVEF
ncbi:MAG: Lpg1974 family pore-forming outer membrane protein [Simkaniaceae bacterium]|nr:Lpg1974 family pore-forming outer membrane protein [Candidatus Sacchlamyda saccharinae]